MHPHVSFSRENVLNLVRGHRSRRESRASRPPCRSIPSFVTQELSCCHRSGARPHFSIRPLSGGASRAMSKARAMMLAGARTCGTDAGELAEIARKHLLRYQALLFRIRHWFATERTTGRIPFTLPASRRTCCGQPDDAMTSSCPRSARSSLNCSPRRGLREEPPPERSPIDEPTGLRAAGRLPWLDVPVAMAAEQHMLALARRMGAEGKAPASAIVDETGRRFAAGEREAAAVQAPGGSSHGRTRSAPRACSGGERRQAPGVATGGVGVRFPAVALRPHPPRLPETDPRQLLRHRP
jgi:hypothetical protein